MGWKSIISGAIKPVTDLIDNMHTSEEEKGKIKQALAQMQNTIDHQLIKSKGDIVKAEAESEHFLTSSWRPITALVFVAIIANNYIIAPYIGAFIGNKAAVMLEIPPQMWDLLKIMIGGYVIGRSGEKALDKWTKRK